MLWSRGQPVRLPARSSSGAASAAPPVGECAALPAGALGGPGARIETTEAIVGPTIAAAVADCGFNGASRGDLIADGINVFATGTDYGSGTNAKPNSLREVGGLTLQCTITATGDDIGDATAGEIEVTYCFFLPAAG
jgi:hypothetical protein